MILAEEDLPPGLELEKGQVVRLPDGSLWEVSWKVPNPIQTFYRLVPHGTS